MDTVQQGAYSARGLLIISDKYEQICQMIDLKLNAALPISSIGWLQKDEKE